MKQYFWDANLIETGENVGGGIFAINEAAAIKELESYGYYTNITVKETK